MGMAVTYGNFGGRIVSESRSGVERDYVRDTLGSTAMLLNNSGNVTDEWTYWPFGETRTRTGATATPFSFVGTLGYYAGSSNHFYIRARYYLPTQSRWLTLDPLWPRELAYGYTANSPVLFVDPSGLETVWDRVWSAFSGICYAATSLVNLGDQGDDVYDRINDCVKRNGGCCRKVDRKLLNCVAFTACSAPNRVKIDYDSKKYCHDDKLYPGLIARIFPTADNPDINKPGGCEKDSKSRLTMVVCPDRIEYDPFNTGAPVHWTVLHELLHCCGVPHGGGEIPYTCNNLISCCILKEAFPSVRARAKC